MLHRLVEVAHAREMMEGQTRPLVVAGFVGAIVPDDRLVRFRSSFAVIGRAECRLPERREREAEQAAPVREMTEEPRHEGHDRLADAGLEERARFVVAAGEESGRLREARPDVGMAGAEAGAPLERAAIHHAVLRAEQPAFVFAL